MIANPERVGSSGDSAKVIGPQGRGRSRMCVDDLVEDADPKPAHRRRRASYEVPTASPLPARTTTLRPTSVKPRRACDVFRCIQARGHAKMALNCTVGRGAAYAQCAPRLAAFLAVPLRHSPIHLDLMADDRPDVRDALTGGWSSHFGGRQFPQIPQRRSNHLALHVQPRGFGFGDVDMH